MNGGVYGSVVDVVVVGGGEGRIEVWVEGDAKRAALPCRVDFARNIQKRRIL